jgi:hypothetical protein
MEGESEMRKKERAQKIRGVWRIKNLKAGGQTWGNWKMGNGGNFVVVCYVCVGTKTL